MAASSGLAGSVPPAAAGPPSARLLETAVPGILAIPGGSWGTAPGASKAGAWGYHVPQGSGTRKVDTSHVSVNLACLIAGLKPELALPWGFLVLHGGTATLVDVPYFSPCLVERILEVAPQGVRRIIFTHSDFIGMAEPEEWHKSCAGVSIVAHPADVSRDGFDLLDGTGPWAIDGFRLDAAPGHTQGSIIVSSHDHSTSLGGDSMGFWEGKPIGYAKMARFSCRHQAKSLRSFADTAPFFEFWFPAHGLPLRFEDLEDRRRQLYEVAEELENSAPHVSAP